MKNKPYALSNKTKQRKKPVPRLAKCECGGGLVAFQGALYCRACGIKYAAGLKKKEG